jgi:hypothetical protein
MRPGITWESSRSLKGWDGNSSWLGGGGGAYKLSLGPNTFVGIADVKLDPNSSLYALPKKSQLRSKHQEPKQLTDSAHRPSSSHAHTRNYSRAAGRSGSWSRRVGR